MIRQIFSNIDRPIASFFLLSLLFFTSCQSANNQDSAIPTLMSAAIVSLPTSSPTIDPAIPPTWTPSIQISALTATPTRSGPQPTSTPQIFPTHTAQATEPIITSPTVTPFPTKTSTPDSSRPIYDYSNVVVKPLEQYAINEIIPVPAYPRPANDNGWGIHWIPTVSQEKWAVDQYVGELNKMHIKWAVILNDNTNIGSNDYLVEQLTAHGIMPVMRLYRSDITPYDGDIGRLVRHYRAKGVYYFQLYNEPNINLENNQGFANPNQYAIEWARAAKEVVNNGGLPGIGALSPGGQYNHYEFLERTLAAIEWNGDGWLLNRTWISIHNYHGLRPLDDPDGFLMFRKYDEIVRHELGRSLPIIGTEGGSYSPDRQVEKDMLTYQYTYMREAEPYFFVFSNWLLTNQAAGAGDATWEWQTLFQQNYVHPVVTDFFYRTSR